MNTKLKYTMFFTGEKHGPNIIPCPWVENLIKTEIPEGTVDLPVVNYDSLLVLTHFKGHTWVALALQQKYWNWRADGRIGKGMIRTVKGSDNLWSIAEEELMERITESSKAIVDHFGKNITFINCLRNMSVSCDCEGVGAEPVVTPNIGIVASTDILAVDQASVDLVFALKDDDRKALCERMTTRHGLRQLSYMKEIGMGNDRYHLIDIDNEDAEISPADAVKDVVPFTAE